MFYREVSRNQNILHSQQMFKVCFHQQSNLIGRNIDLKSAWELLTMMATKNFTISHFLKISIEDNLLPYPSDTVSFLHDLNYGYQLLKMVRDIDSSNERIKRRVNNVIEEFFVIYAKIGPEPVTIQVQASGIPSPRYEWFYRPNDGDPNNPSEEITWIPLPGQAEVSFMTSLEVGAIITWKM